MKRLIYSPRSEARRAWPLAGLLSLSGAAAVAWCVSAPSLEARAATTPAASAKPTTKPAAPAAPAAPAKPVNIDAGKFALVIGINKYPDPYQLNGCVNDAKSISQALQTDFGFPKENILVLTDAQATNKSIVAAFKAQLIANARRYSSAHPGGHANIVFFFSGHGQEIPDDNGDEAKRDPTDDQDESICPYDTLNLDANGIPNNVRDDTLNALYTELAHYTTQATFIFDSCHSGTVTRQLRRIKEIPSMSPTTKSIASEKHVMTTATKSPSPASPDDDLPRVGDWVSFSGCTPSETSVDADFPPGPHGGAHGVLTYYLLSAMDRATTHTTNGAIWQEVARGAASSRVSTQHPMIEGKVGALFLGGALKTEEPPVTYQVQGNQVVIGAGTNQGARKGGLFNLLTLTTKSLGAGETDAANNAKLNLSITKSDADRSYADIPDDKNLTPEQIQLLKTLPKTGKAELLTPYFGFDPVKIKLDLPADSDVGSGLRTILSDTSASVRLLTLAKADETPDLTVCYGPRSAVDLSAQGEAGKEKLYYILQSGKVLYDAFFDDHLDVVTGQPAAIEDLRSTLENFAQQRNLQTLSNPTNQSLNGAITATFYRVPGHMEGKGDNATFVRDAGNPTKFTATSTGSIKVQQGIGLEIHYKNNTPSTTLYVSVANIGTDGAIFLLPPVDAPDAKSFKLEPGETNKSRLFYTIPPGGLDTYKVLVTTTPTDFSWLERQAVAGKDPTGSAARGPHNPLEDLMAMSSGVVTRGIRLASTSPDMSGWTTFDLRVDVTATPPAKSKAITFSDH